MTGPAKSERVILPPAMASKLNPNVLYVRETQESLSSPDSDRLTHAEAGDESSDSDGEPEEASHKLIRKVSTSGQIRAKVSGDSTKRSSAHSVIPITATGYHTLYSRPPQAFWYTHTHTHTHTCHCSKHLLFYESSNPSISPA